jgi:NAD-reducing hydrogenase large subunit
MINAYDFVNHIDERRRAKQGPTEYCNTAYNGALTQVAKKYLDGSKLSEGLLNKVERVIRAFDPCLSCSSHALGSIGLLVRVCGPDGNLLDEAIR